MTTEERDEAILQALRDLVGALRQQAEEQRRTVSALGVLHRSVEELDKTIDEHLSRLVDVARFAAGE